MKIKIFIILFGIGCCFSRQAKAQIKIEDITGKIGDLLSKKNPVSVKKGFSPIFSLGKLQLNKVGILGEKLKGVAVLGQVFDSKGIQQVTKLFKTYKTGLVVFKVLAAAGSVATIYSTARGIAGTDKFDDKTVRKLITPALSSLLVGVVTKVLTKKASYKAVDIFNGVVKNKIKNIFSVAPATNTNGIGLFVKL